MPKSRLFVTILIAVATVLLLSTSVFAAASFPDVPSTNPYSGAVLDLATRGVINGYTNGNFGVDDLVTRQQFAKMIVKTLGLEVTGTEVSPFVDVVPVDSTDPNYPVQYVAVCAANGITKGTDATHFSPALNITRAQVITMVVRAAQNLAPSVLQDPGADWAGDLSYSDPTHGENIKIAEFNGLLAGITGADGTLASWDTTGYATRGELAQILHNLRLTLLPPLADGALLRVVKADGSAVQFTLEQLKGLAQGSITVDGKSQDGPYLSAVLNATGVTDFNAIMLTGARGPMTVNVIEKSELDDTCILDFTNQDTVKFATEAIPMSDWAKDIFVIEVL
jgi:hypothetical protein